MRDGRPDPPPPHDDSTATLKPRPRHPEAIGEYRIVRKIGEGGMGVVYEAEQQHPRRAVALKVIRGGAYVDDQSVRLFHREAQALARLKHPGIAAIYESGRTDDGQHFFAMELVRGETLGSYLRKRSGSGAPVIALELRERLALFRKVCDAVSYAHQRGVIHRDLKPSNILVQRETAAGAGGPASVSTSVPDIKILDFGLARITDSDVAMTTIMTEAGKIQGTLPYMSPEQVRGHADEIDLRSDVYSLGVILYELISGRLPLEVMKVALPEAMRVICEEPPQPLTRTFSGTRKLDADLGTIVAKALEKEPARRYQSAAALSEDLQRFLSDQPILARPPSAMYQFRKLVLRHKAAFGFIAALFVLLLGFAVTMTLQAERIARERDRANVEAERANREAETAKTVSEFLVGLFQVSDPGEARGRTITAMEILDAGAAKIDRELKDQPLTQASLMDTMGNVYRSLALFDHAESLLGKALQTRESLMGPSHTEVAETLVSFGRVRSAEQRYEEAVPLYRRALAIQESAFGSDDVRVGWTLHHLGNALNAKGASPEGRPVLERAMVIFEKDLGPDHWAVAWCLNDLAGSFFMQGNPGEAEPLYRRALTLKEKSLGADHPDVAIGMNNLGLTLARLGDYEGARRLIERSLTIQEKSLGADHPEVAVTLSSFGDLFRLQGRFEEARPYYERTLAIFSKRLGPDAPDLAWALDSFARVLQGLGEFGRAEDHFKRALAIREKLLPAGDPATAETLEGYASLLRKVGRAAEAGALEARATAIRERAVPASASR